MSDLVIGDKLPQIWNITIWVKSPPNGEGKAYEVAGVAYVGRTSFVTQV